MNTQQASVVPGANSQAAEPQTIETTTENQAQATQQGDDTAKRLATIAAQEKRYRELVSKQKADLDAEKAKIEQDKLSFAQKLKIAEAIEKGDYAALEDVIDFQKFAQYKMQDPEERDINSKLSEVESKYEQKLKAEIEALKNELKGQEEAKAKAYQETITQAERNFIGNELTKAAAAGKFTELAKMNDEGEMVDLVYNLWKEEDAESRKTNGSPVQFDFEKYAALVEKYQDEQLLKVYSKEKIMKLYGISDAPAATEAKPANPFNKPSTLTNSQHTPPTETPSKLSGQALLQKSKEEAAKLIKFI